MVSMYLLGILLEGVLQKEYEINQTVDGDGINYKRLVACMSR